MEKKNKLPSTQLLVPKPQLGGFFQGVNRHDICQKFYATAVLAERILRKKSVNRDIRQFATKERKCFKMA